MPNTTGYGGFQHIGFVPGYIASYELMARKILGTNATTIFKGDPVIFNAGYINAAAVSTSQVAGIFSHCTYVNSSNQTVWSNYVPISTTATAYTLESPGSLFLVQSNGTAVNQTSVNLNCGFVRGSGGSTATGFSTALIDAANISTVATYPFKIIQLGSDLLGGTGAAGSTPNGTDNTTSYNAVIVTFNSQGLRAGQTGV
jgi:3D (Asp-Asp-Asp) domain-containing protein